VVRAKPLEETGGKLTILRRTVSELMARPVVLANGNENVFIYVEWVDQALGENVHDIVIGIRSVIEFCTERSLPFLSLQHMFCVRCMKNKTLKLNLAYASQLRPQLEGWVQVVANAIGTFNEADFRIKVR